MTMPTPRSRTTTDRTLAAGAIAAGLTLARFSRFADGTLCYEFADDPRLRQETAERIGAEAARNRSVELIEGDLKRREAGFCRRRGQAPAAGQERGDRRRVVQPPGTRPDDPGAVRGRAA